MPRERWAGWSKRPIASTSTAAGGRPRKLCANDPVCAQHQPESRQEERFLFGAACHGCLLLAESSCERRNDFLDRALVVPTVDGDGAAFFTEA